MRIQFYPSDELEDKLNKEADALGVNVSVLVNDLLNKHYGLVPPDAMSDAQIEQLVISEIKDYIKDPNHTDEFDLNMGSQTYSKIEMIYAGKPRILKARLGKTFAKLIGTGEFKHVEQVMLSNGKPKRTVGNRAALYIINWAKRSAEETQNE